MAGREGRKGIEMAPGRDENTQGRGAGLRHQEVTNFGVGLSTKSQKTAVYAGSRRHPDLASPHLSLAGALHSRVN